MDCLINVKGNLDVRIDSHLLVQTSVASLPSQEETKLEEPAQEVVPVPEEEEKKEEPVPIIEEKKTQMPVLPLIKRVSRSPSPPKPLMAMKISLNSEGDNLKLPNLMNLKFGMVRNIFEEALNDHKKIPIPKCHWAYKLEPTTINENHCERDFFYITPYIFARWATPEVLERGLLRSIEFRENDKCLSAIRMTFDNG